MDFHTELTTLYQNSQGQTFNDFCIKADDNADCDVDNFLAIWDYNRTEIPDEQNMILFDINQFIRDVPESVR